MTTMTNLRETTIHSHNQTLAATWSSAGAAYDEVSRGIIDAIEHALDRLEPQPGDRLLDIATGTGWAARRLAARGFTVTGVDFAPDLLAAATAFAEARGLDIPFVHGDAEALPFDDAAFDGLLSTFGVIFAQRPEAAAAELARVCRPGGRVVLATWTPDGNVFEMFRIMKAYMPEPTGTPPPSPFEWGRPERVANLLGEHFELTLEPGTSIYREPSGAAAWRTFVTGYGPLRTLAGKLDAAGRARLEADFIAFHDSFATELGICVPRNYWIVKGTRR